MYDFSKAIERKNTKSVKWDDMGMAFGQEDLLPMWVADMDFRPPEEALEAMKERISHGVFGYTVADSSVKEAIIQWASKRHGFVIKPNELLFSSGVVPSISLAIQAFTKPGDKVLLQSPVYTPFFHMIETNDRQVINSPLQLVNGRYEIDFDDFEAKAASGVKLFLLCSPHNPTGRVWTKDELERLAEICEKNGILIVSDEIHADLVRHPFKHTPIATVNGVDKKNTITLMAPSKTFNLAGLQASFLVIPDTEIQQKIAAVQARQGFSSLNTFGIIAMEAAYRHGEKWLDEVLAYIGENFMLIKQEIGRHLPTLQVIEPEGTYLIWIDCRKLGLTFEEMSERLLKKGKLAVNMGASYGEGGEGFIRINAACSREIIQEGMNRLKKAFG